MFAEAAAREYPTLRPGTIPAEAFPLFLSSRQFLRMLDGGCWLALCGAAGRAAAPWQRYAMLQAVVVVLCPAPQKQFADEGVPVYVRIM